MKKNNKSFILLPLGLLFLFFMVIGEGTAQSYVNPPPGGTHYLTNTNLQGTNPNGDLVEIVLDSDGNIVSYDEWRHNPGDTEVEASMFPEEDPKQIEHAYTACNGNCELVYQGNGEDLKGGAIIVIPKPSGGKKEYTIDPDKSMTYTCISGCDNGDPAEEEDPDPDPAPEPDPVLEPDPAPEPEPTPQSPDDEDENHEQQCPYGNDQSWEEGREDGTYVCECGPQLPESPPVRCFKKYFCVRWDEYTAVYELNSDIGRANNVWIDGSLVNNTLIRSKGHLCLKSRPPDSTRCPLMKDYCTRLSGDGLCPEITCPNTHMAYDTNGCIMCGE